MFSMSQILQLRKSFNEVKERKKKIKVKTDKKLLRKYREGKMKRSESLLITFILIVLLTNSCSNYKDELLTFLPTQHEGWGTKGKPEIYAKTKLYNYINGGAEVFFKYGFDSLITQEYCFEDKSITVEIYKMKSPKSALEIYGYNRNPQFPTISIGNEGENGGSRIIFWQDKYYVVVHTFDSSLKGKPILLSMAKTVSAKIQGVTKRN